ncbi:bifunctional salicylyl-CoA 5-hydroxylase/oxidoreductase [Acidisphaera sp. S103]|uniref:bifunctional salicylyl-CoA 5-hydroxylase/oxidoreductase n=1 Tax=Acidisphaera sp. S103 TaxID=1747223 RepID=UPI00131E6DD6|nr:bifunctional salicylyl-CoA 5-hydroxylase/oxidoreductase [Acidisphaera sp. S103]
MRVAVIGGGPAGLYFAILLKRDRPDTHITVVERNRPNDTFGFGVVFSDQTLDTFAAADEPSYNAITDAFAYWDDVEIHVRGTVHRVGGNGFCGCSRRTLLMLLHDRAKALGVELVFNTEARPEDFPDADLIVAADGINSAIRARHEAHFQPNTDLRPNRFAWMGSTRPFDAFTFFFKERPEGIFIAHCYQYERGASTWVLEVEPETLLRAGLDQATEAESARFMEDVFAEELAGHKLITNRSQWRQFPMIRCARWTKGNVVLLGDAKATAHFSIGSGTKLAMEDAIALHAAVVAGGSIQQSLARFENGRREAVEKIQHAADVSLVWFEHVRRFWPMHPTRFAFGVMTRSKAITYDDLALRAPAFIKEVDALFAYEVAGNAQPLDIHRPPMFQPFRLRGMNLVNRVVVSPMCQYSARDGMPTDWHLVHYGARATGGSGLIYTEMTCPSADARITPGCTGLWNDAQKAAWTRIVSFTHANGSAKICLQLGHAGRKGATRLMWDGMDRPLPQGGWPIISASAIPYTPENQVPRAMDRSDMDRVVEDFRLAAIRGESCNFDMLELHCAHGYLLASFLSPLTNTRTDMYGGSVENRLRFPLEVFDAMRAVWPDDKPMSVRLSATDWADGGISEPDVAIIARTFAAHGCDLIDVSTGQTVADAAPVYGRMFQVPFSDMIRNETGLSTMCVGSITSADQINTILAAGRADLVALARPHLVDTGFAMRAAADYGVTDIPCPVQYEYGRDALMRSAARERADLLELRKRARPKSHGGAGGGHPTHAM